MAKRFIILIAILLAAAASVIACAPANIKDVPEVSDGPDAGILPDNEDSFSSVTTKPGKEVMRTPDITTKPDEETTLTPATTPSTGEQTTPEKIDWRQFRKTDCSCSIFDVTIKSDGTLVPPGTLPEVENIPDADMSDVGKTVSGILATTCKYAEFSAAYYYNPVSAKERLVTIDYHFDYCQVALLSVYETDFGGPRGFYNAVEKGNVDAKLIGRCYITFQEAMYVSGGLYRDEVKAATADSVKGNVVLATIATVDGKREFKVINAAEEAASKIEVLERIYERFDQRFGLKSLVSTLSTKKFRTSDCSCSIIDEKIKCDGTLVPPGTLDKVEDIPDADMSDVGKTVSNILVPSCGYAYISAAYYYNAENAKERLVTIEVHPDSQVSLLSVYETDFGGPRGFYNAVEKGKVDAKLTGRCYISFIEAIRENTPGFYHYDGKLATADSVGGDLVVATVRIFEGKREFRVMNADDEIATTPISELYEIIYERFDQRFGLKALVSVK